MNNGEGSLHGSAPKETLHSFLVVEEGRPSCVPLGQRLFFFGSRTGVSAVGMHILYLIIMDFLSWLHDSSMARTLPRSIINALRGPVPKQPQAQAQANRFPVPMRSVGNARVHPWSRRRERHSRVCLGPRGRAGPTKSQPPTTRSRFGCRGRGR